jgi:hypothetical protein
LAPACYSFSVHDTRTAATLGRLARFAAAVTKDAPRIDLALPAVRELLHAAGVPFRLVGGVAVVHHGYARTTEDIDVLVDSARASHLSDEVLSARGFRRISRARLEHVADGVRVDLLWSSEPVPRRTGDVYPAPQEVAASPEDPDFVGLAPLLHLKLLGGRHQDRADVVALLKRLDEAHYLSIEAALPARFRPELSGLRRDALEELAFER